MKVELHLHTNRYSLCAIVNPRQVLTKCMDCGYDVVYLTEHDAIWSERELAEIREDFPRLRIYPGMEVSTGGMHLLVLGTNDPEYIGPPPEEVILRARDRGHLTVLAHPFRWQGAAEVLEGDILPDALEYQTCNHSPEMAALAAEAGGRLDLPVVNAGDVHGLNMVDRYWISTDVAVDEAADIREIVRERAYDNHRDPDISDLFPPE